MIVTEHPELTPSAAPVAWHLRGRGYEYCNCTFGCGCNFGGYPSSYDGSCNGFVGLDIIAGNCGAVALSDVKCALILSWPKAMHEGDGRAVLIVEPSCTAPQVHALSRIFSGELGGLPWGLLGSTFTMLGLRRVPITITGEGRKSTFRAEGVGEGRGTIFRNPITGEDHVADIESPDGLMWKRGECGRGSFEASASGVSVSGTETNWIYYTFNWSSV